MVLVQGLMMPKYLTHIIVLSLVRQFKTGEQEFIQFNDGQLRTKTSLSFRGLVVTIRCLVLCVILLSVASCRHLYFMCFKLGGPEKSC